MGRTTDPDSFFVTISAGIICTVTFPSVAVTGKIARFALIPAFVFAQRNLLIGMPVDKAILYRKLACRVVGLTGLLHTTAYFFDPNFRSKYKATL